MYTAERPESSEVAAGEGTGKTWSYDEAFGRNLGLISRDGQRGYARPAWPSPEWAGWAEFTS